MAKARKSVFNTPATKEELTSQAKAIETKALTGKEKKKEKPKILYVDAAHHQMAKIQATKKGMKLGSYIEWLIAQQE